jgi:glycosyltransferase involved in cell wall biosynthesis
VTGVKKIKVYHFILDHRVGGPHVYVDTLRHALADRVESVLVTTGHGPMTERSLINLRHLWSPLYAVELLLNALWLVFAVLLGRIQRRGAVFNVHGGANLAPLMAARVTGIPVVWHIHETTTSFRRFVNLGRRVMHGGRHAIAVVAERSREIYELESAEFLPASVDTSFWTRKAVSDEACSACGWLEAGEAKPQRAFRLLAVGNLNPLKGQDVLLEALAGLDGAWHLQIVGAELATHKEFADALRRRAHALMAANKLTRVDFLGWQDREKVRALLASCDLFVLPSRSEACPIALLEAIAMGCRCVSADVGDSKNMLQKSSMARLFVTGSSDGCLKKIREMRALCEEISPTSEDSTGNAWKLSSVANKTLDLYEFLAKKQL